MDRRLKSPVARLLCACALAVAGGAVVAVAQAPADTPESHRAAAKAAAGQDHPGLFSVICEPPAPRPSRPAAAVPAGPPPRAAWHAEPVKVFDNLYYVGEKTVSAWAVTTSAGIILIDTIFDYAAEDEIVAGLEKLKLDPAQIKYAIVTHGHDDHFSGAKYLQDRFKARIVLSAPDWDLIEAAPPQAKPRRDMVVTDGQTLTLGDTTLTLYVTPGHTLGTLSVLIPVKDHGVPHLALEWGGASFSWLGDRPGYLTPTRPRSFWYKHYIESAQRMRDIAAKTGVDVVISNHAIFDGSETKLPATAARQPGAPNPYVIGADSVRRYFTVADECAQAGLLEHP
jgi:metallo-beta-lactamase class B